jgi:hypothetical protein
LWKVWEPTGQDGPRGPLPLQPLLDWEAGDPRRKVIWTPPLPMSGAEIERFIGRAEPSVGTIRYARLGLFHNWLHQRCNVSISGGRKSSVAHWQCAETLVRWCDPETRCRVFLAGEFRYDDYVPSSGRAAGVMEMALEWARRAGITDCAFASSATACGQAL